MEQPFNSTKIVLDAEKHGLDEDGCVYVRNQFSVRSALAFNAYAKEDVETGEQAVASEDVPPLLFLESVVCGWEIKAGVELVFSLENIGELPTSIFQQIIEEVENLPLAQVSSEDSPSSTNLSGLGGPGTMTP